MLVKELLDAWSEWSYVIVNEQVENKRRDKYYAAHGHLKYPEDVRECCGEKEVDSFYFFICRDEPVLCVTTKGIAEE